MLIPLLSLEESCDFILQYRTSGSVLQFMILKVLSVRFTLTNTLNNKKTTFEQAFSLI